MAFNYTLQPIPCLLPERAGRSRCALEANKRKPAQGRLRFLAGLFPGRYYCFNRKSLRTDTTPFTPRASSVARVADVALETKPDNCTTPL